MKKRLLLILVVFSVFFSGAGLVAQEIQPNKNNPDNEDITEIGTFDIGVNHPCNSPALSDIERIDCKLDWLIQTNLDNESMIKQDDFSALDDEPILPPESCRFVSGLTVLITLPLITEKAFENNDIRLASLLGFFGSLIFGYGTNYACEAIFAPVPPAVSSILLEKSQTRAGGSGTRLAFEIVDFQF